jgi:hypothetical protein
VFVEIMWKGKGAMGGAKRRIAYTRVALSQLHPATRVYDASMPPDGEKVPWSQEGWLDLTSDALAARGRGSTTLRHQRPMGHVLTRMILQQPQAVRNLSPLPSSWARVCLRRPPNCIPYPGRATRTPRKCGRRASFKGHFMSPRAPP